MPRCGCQDEEVVTNLSIGGCVTGYARDTMIEADCNNMSWSLYRLLGKLLLLKDKMDMMGRLLDCFFTLGGGDDLLYTKMSCYI